MPVASEFSWTRALWLSDDECNLVFLGADESGAPGQLFLGNRERAELVELPKNADTNAYHHARGLDVVQAAEFGVAAVAGLSKGWALGYEKSIKRGLLQLSVHCFRDEVRFRAHFCLLPNASHRTKAGPAG